MNTTNTDEIFDARQEINDARTKVVVGHALVGISAAAIGISVYLFLSRPSVQEVSNKETFFSSIGVSPTKGGAALFLRGSL